MGLVRQFKLYSSQIGSLDFFIGFHSATKSWHIRLIKHLAIAPPTGISFLSGLPGYVADFDKPMGPAWPEQDYHTKHSTLELRIGNSDTVVYLPTWLELGTLVNFSNLEWALHPVVKLVNGVKIQMLKTMLDYKQAPWMHPKLPIIGQYGISITTPVIELDPTRYSEVLPPASPKGVNYEFGDFFATSSVDANGNFYYTYDATDNYALNSAPPSQKSTSPPQVMYELAYDHAAKVGYTPSPTLALRGPELAAAYGKLYRVVRAGSAQTGYIKGGPIGPSQVDKEKLYSAYSEATVAFSISVEW